MSKMKYTTSTANKLNPYFVTGFSDGEACFTLTISKNPRHTLGWSVKLVFSIHLHSKDIDILYQIQRFFGVGNVYLHGKAATYQVVKLSDLACIIEHFDTYPLLTKKYANFLLFKKAFDIIKIKEHLTKAGLLKLISIRATLNKGLPKRLSAAFTKIISVPKPEIPKTTLVANTQEIKHWFAGFVSAEGCFFIKVSNSKTHKLGKNVGLNFSVSQNRIDSKLLESFTQILGCGSYSILKNTGIGIFSVSGFNNVINKVIPFFEEYPIIGVKTKDFEDFKQASILIKSKAHLTSEGLDKILLIKSGMNFKRKI